MSEKTGTTFWDIASQYPKTVLLLVLLTIGLLAYGLLAGRIVLNTGALSIQPTNPGTDTPPQEKQHDGVTQRNTPVSQPENKPKLQDNRAPVSPDNNAIKPANAQDQSYPFTGTVLGADRKSPLEGVTVKYEGLTTTTNAAGYFSLPFSTTKGQQVKLTLAKNGKSYGYEMPSGVDFVFPPE